MHFLKHPRPRDVVIAELRMLAKTRRHLQAQADAVTERITRLLDDLLEARQQEQQR